MPESTTQRLILTLVVVLVAVAVRLILTVVINRVVALVTHDRTVELSAKASAVLARAGAKVDRQTQRVRTLGSLLRNVTNVTIAVVSLLTVLAVWGVPMGPLLASAGIGGIAFGFGAQSLVKDYLSGVFMLAEDQFGVGDHVRIGALTGTVQEVALRVTKVLDADGVVWYIRNGEMAIVGNATQAAAPAGGPGPEPR